MSVFSMQELLDSSLQYTDNPQGCYSHLTVFKHKVTRVCSVCECKLPQWKALWKTPEMKHCWSHSLDRKQHSWWRWGKRESCGWFCLPGDCHHLHCFVNSWEQILSLTVEAKQGSPMHHELYIETYLKLWSITW